MKFALIHLSGSRRGETQYFDRSLLTLGSDPACDVRFPRDGRHPVAPSHADIFQGDCEIVLRTRALEDGVLVNQQPVRETALRDKDLIQLGPKGPKLRFRIRPEEYAACKLVREILQDARDVAQESRDDGRHPLWSFLKQVAYDVRRHASRPARMVLWGLVLALAGTVAGLIGYAYYAQQAHERDVAVLLRALESTRLSQADLERKAEEQRRRMEETLAARQAELDRVAAQLHDLQQRGREASGEEVQTLRRRLEALETHKAVAEALIVRYGSAVCFLHVTYGFVSQGSPSGGPLASLDVVGTGFLTDAAGMLVTNRHLLEPWTMDQRGTAEMAKSGLEPRLTGIRAFCPGHPDPYEVSVVRVAQHYDVGLGQLHPVPRGIPPIPLPTGQPRGVPGEAVVVLGYPAGIEGVLARLEDTVTIGLLRSVGHDLARLSSEVSKRGGFRPLATQGHISDVTSARIMYDARTTGGGSGSPVFNSRGELIAVHAAIMTRFEAIGFGVPVSHVSELLAQP
jgi:S1-C subfamily serine protease